MTIAGFKIIKCPYCSQLYKERIIGSYNSFSSIQYSDGYMQGPWVPIFYTILKCVNIDCGKFFNIRNEKVVAELNSDEFDLPEWKDAYYLAGYNLEVKDLEEALTTEFCVNQENEKKVRSFLFWRYNDTLRADRKYQLKFEENNKRINNIQKLIELNKNQPTASGEIYLAELYREKEDYDTCIRILSEIQGEKDYEKTIKEKIYSQAKVKDNKVFDIQLVAIKKEYKCNTCGDNLILFDLEKNDSRLDHKHYQCNIFKNVFNSPSKQGNPSDYYKLNFCQKLFKIKKPYERLIPKTEIHCPQCDTIDVKLFNPETEKCIKCNEGIYITVNWFDFIK